MFHLLFQNLTIKEHFSYSDFVRFNGNRCNVCAILHKIHKSIIQKGPSKSCAGCKLISYCCIEHQKLDWPMHKDFCKAVQYFLKDTKLEHPLHRHNDTIKSKADLISRAKMLEDLLEIFLDLLYFPRICKNCFSFKLSNQWNCSISDTEGDISTNGTSSGCKLVSYCSSECKKSHQPKHDCKNLQIATNFYDKDLEILPNFKLNTKKMFKLNMKKQQNLIDCLEKFINIKIPKVPKNTEEFQKFYSASKFNYVMTTSYVLDFCNTLQKPKINNELTIYIIGGREQFFIINYIHFQNEYLLFLISQMPSIKHLTLVFISEFMEDITEEEEIYYKGRKYNIKWIFIQGNFKDFVDDLVMKNILFGRRPQFFNLNKIDLILSFDCNFAKYSNPFMDIRNIHRILQISNVPIAFTSRTLGDATDDWNIIRNSAIDMDITFEILMKTKENPFKDHHPIPNIFPSDEDVSFINKYLSIIKVNK